MRRTIALIGVGVFSGAVGTCLYLYSSQHAGLQDTYAIRGQRSQNGDAGAQPAFASIESAIERALLQTVPGAPSRELEVLSLLVRLSAIDVPRAIELSVTLDVNQRTLSAAFQYFAQLDLQVTVAAIARIKDLSTRRAVALALVEVLEDLERSVDLIADSLPGIEADTFVIDALARLAERSPVTMLQRAMALEGPIQRSLAVSRIAVALVDTLGPQNAMLLASNIDDHELKASFHASVFGAWAESDVESAFAFIEESIPREVPNSSRAFEILSGFDPYRVIDVSGRLPPALRQAARATAVGELARRDPLDALAYVESLPSGGEALIPIIAETFARQEPVSAWAWARSLGRPEIQSVVLLVVGRQDFDQGLNLAIEAAAQGSSASSLAPALQSILIGQIGVSSERVRGALDRLSVIDSPLLQEAVDYVAAYWSRVEPQNALSWVTQHTSSLSPAAVSGIAESMGTADPNLAMQSIDSLPSDMRGDWLSGAAGGIARSDLTRAIEWVSGYRDTSAYEDAIASMISNGATQLAPVEQFPEVARLLESVTSENRGNLAINLARAWGMRAPQAAAEWAFSLEADGPIRSDLIMSLATISKGFSALSFRVF